MISIALALLLRAVDAPLETAQREAINPIPVVEKTTHSDPQAIEWLKKIDRTDGGDGSCYIEFEREKYDPIWQERDIAPVRYFFVKGREGRLCVIEGRCAEAICWTTTEFTHANPKSKRFLVIPFGTHQSPNRWFVADLILKPNIEQFESIASISISKEDDSNVTIRLRPTKNARQSHFFRFRKVFESLIRCDSATMFIQLESLEVEIHKSTGRVQLARLYEQTKQIDTYNVKTTSTDRKSIEQSLDSSPIKAPEGWKVDRYPMPAE